MEKKERKKERKKILILAVLIAFSFTPGAVRIAFADDLIDLLATKQYSGPTVDALRDDTASDDNEANRNLIPLVKSYWIDDPSSITKPPVIEEEEEELEGRNTNTPSTLSSKDFYNLSNSFLKSNLSGTTIIGFNPIRYNTIEGATSSTVEDFWWSNGWSSIRTTERHDSDRNNPNWRDIPGWSSTKDVYYDPNGILRFESIITGRWNNELDRLTNIQLTYEIRMWDENGSRIY